MGRLMSGKAGQIPIDHPLYHQLNDVVLESYISGITVQSNTARVKAPVVAAAASLGFITTQVGAEFGRVWRPTQVGLKFFMED